MEILASLQCEISYQMNYIATGAEAFCDTYFMDQRCYTKIHGKREKAEWALRVIPKTC